MLLRGRIEHREAKTNAVEALRDYFLKNPLAAISGLSTAAGLMLLTAIVGHTGFVPRFETGQMTGVLAIMLLLGLLLVVSLAVMLMLPALVGGELLPLERSAARRQRTAYSIGVGFFFVFAVGFVVIGVDHLGIYVAVVVASLLLAAAWVLSELPLTTGDFVRAGRTACFTLLGCATALFPLLAILTLVRASTQALDSPLQMQLALLGCASICAVFWFIAVTAAKQAPAWFVPLLSLPLVLIVLTYSGALGGMVGTLLNRLQLGNMNFVQLRLSAQACDMAREAWGEPACTRAAPDQPGTVCPVRVVSRLGDEWALERGAALFTTRNASGDESAVPLQWHARVSGDRLLPRRVVPANEVLAWNVVKDHWQGPAYSQIAIDDAELKSALCH